MPKIPSMKIVDLASAMAPDLPFDIIGIRIDEKLHEIMCPSDDSHLTFEFDDHFVISPTIQFSQVVDFSTNKLGQNGKAVKRGFEYNSGNNSEWLTHSQFLEMVEK